MTPFLAWFVISDVRNPDGSRETVSCLVSAVDQARATRLARRLIRGAGGTVGSSQAYPAKNGLAVEWRRFGKRTAR